MKKIISTALAASMVASMATVAFAIDATSIKVDENSRLYKEKDGILFEVAGDVALAPGQTIYVEVLPEVAGESISSRVAGQHKIVLDWNNGKETIDSTSITNKKVSLATGSYILKSGETAPYSLATSYNTLADLQGALDAVIKHSDICKVINCEDPYHLEALTQEEKTAATSKYTTQSQTSYQYVAAITTKQSYTTKQSDLIGSVKVVKKSTSNSTSSPSKTIAAVVGHGIAEISGDMHEVDNDAPVIDFDDVDGDVELLFGGTASFTVDAQSQSDLFLGYSEKPNGDIIDQNLDANIDFITFKSTPSFNRMGMMRLFAEEDMFIYEIKADGSLKALDSAYDEDYAAYSFKTRALTSYAISDMELTFDGGVEEEKPSEKPITPPTTSKPNPETGRGNMTGSVAALVALSIASLAVVAAKKSK